MQRKVTLLSFSQSEMLEEWKMRKGLFSGLRDCTAERDDGVDVDGLLLREIDSWYARLLAEAPIDCLPVEDVALECTVEIGADLRVDVVLPSRCVRLVSMKMKSWQEAVAQFEKEGGMLALRQANAWLRGGVCNPVCIAGIGRIRAYSAAAATDELERLETVCFPENGNYVFTERAWTVFPELFAAI